MICEADPSAFGHLHDICRRAFFGVDIEFGHIVIFGFVQFAVGHAHHALVQNKKAFKVARFAVAGNLTVGSQRYGRRAVVLHGLLDREHEILIDRYHALKGQAFAIVPGQGHGRCGGQLGGFGGPKRGGARHVGRINARGGGPTVNAVIGVVGAFR